MKLGILLVGCAWLAGEAYGRDFPAAGGRAEELARLWESGQYAQAEQIALSLLEELEKSGIYGPSLAVVLNNLCAIQLELVKPEEAERLCLSALRIVEQPGSGSPELTAKILNNLGLANDVMGRLAKAWSYAERAARIPSAGHANLAVALNRMARVRHAQGRHREAEGLYVKSLSIWEAGSGSDSREAAVARYELATLLISDKAYTKAEALLRGALQALEAHSGPSHLLTGDVLFALGRLLRRLERYTEAEPLLRRSLAIVRQSLGSDNVQVAVVLSEYAKTLRKLNRKGEARGMEKEARVIQRLWAEQHPQYTVDVSDLAARAPRGRW